MYSNLAVLVLMFYVATVAATPDTLNSLYYVPKTQQQYEKAMRKLGLTATRQDLPNPLNTTLSKCAQCCTSLKAYLPNSAFNSSTQRYVEEKSSYWSNIQAVQKPTCYVRPNFAQEVAGSVLTSEFYKCPFAVRSGGYAAFAGASNINGGFTIDLRNLQEIRVLKSKNITTRIGTGNRWGDVYTKLDKKNLTVVGGRAYDVGIGGLILGGGISFFSNRYGWACDNVVNYEIVVSGGQVTNANATFQPDLYLALKGGGNNLGIVTAVDLATYPQGKIWHSRIRYKKKQTLEVLQAFVDFANDSPRDPDADVYLALIYAKDRFFHAAELTYAHSTSNPRIFSRFTSLSNLGNTTEISTLGYITKKFNKESPSGFQQATTTATFVLDRALLEEVSKIFQHEIEKLSVVQELVAILRFQLITKDMAKHSNKHGGNVLGIKVGPKPLVIIEITGSWSQSTNSEDVVNILNRIRRLAVHRARHRNLHNRFIHQNFASEHQRPLLSYGEDNFAKLIAASKKYDSQQTFQKLEPGYFKLSR